MNEIKVEINLNNLENLDSIIEKSLDKVMSNTDLELYLYKKSGYNVKSISKEMRNNVFFMFQAVEYDIHCLSVASESIRDYDIIIKRAIDNCKINDVTYVVKYSSEEIRNNKRLMLEAIKRNVKCYSLLSEELKNDKDILEILNYKNNKYILNNK